MPTAVTHYDNLPGLFPSEDPTSTSGEPEPGGDQDREADRPEACLAPGGGWGEGGPGWGSQARPLGHSPDGTSCY